MSYSLFTYGSLMFPQVWHQLVPQTRPSHPAFLTKFSRRLILLDTYPLLIEDANGGILGTVYSQLSGSDLERLDYFEGEIYQRVTVAVHTEQGIKPCQTYIPKPQYRCLAMQDYWRGDIFRAVQMSIFLGRYCRNNIPD
jgi:gamma-glutamylcyclotransferase (GGCT)/AIG2-like uncharacterized protein YtfP